MAAGIGFGFGGTSALIVAGCAHRAIRNVERIAQGVGQTRVPNSHRPWPASLVAPANVHIASRVDREIPEGAKFVCSHIDRQPLGDGAKIEQQRAKQRNCLAIRIEAHISIRCRSAARGSDSDRTAAAILAVESARLHRGAHRRIESSPGLLGHRQRKPNCFVEDSAGRNRDADRRREPRQFALRIEPRAALFNPLKPAKRALDRRFELGRFPRFAGTYNIDGHQGAHQRFRAAINRFTHWLLGIAAA